MLTPRRATKYMHLLKLAIMTYIYSDSNCDDDDENCDDIDDCEDDDNDSDDRDGNVDDIVVLTVVMMMIDDDVGNDGTTQHQPSPPL